MSGTFEGVVVSIGSGHYQTTVRTPGSSPGGGHVLTADEPASLGGTDTGPTPYELLLGAVGACKAITVRMYADRKGWPLDEAVIALRHDRRHPEEHSDAGAANGDEKLDHIDVDLQFLGDLTAEQRARLAEIADRCPVHRAITGDLRVMSRLIEE